MSDFKDRIIQIVRLIPKGKVVSYGQVALYAGTPRAARQVGWILSSLTTNDLPWWRVVNREGRISIKGSRYTAVEQRELLLAEGVGVADDMTLDIQKYRFNPDIKLIESLELPSVYVNFLMTKLPV